jgi:hypothetical protein
MKRTLILATALLTIGCSASAPLEAMDATMANALVSGDTLAAREALCAFVDMDASCVGEGGPVPPPPPSETDAGYIWLTMELAGTGNEYELNFAMEGSYQTQDGSQQGSFLGLINAPTDKNESHITAESRSREVSWRGTVAGENTPSEDDPTTGSLEGMWAKSRYTQVAHIEGTWRLDPDLESGRLIGSFDFSPSFGPEEEPTEGGTEGPLEDPAI